MRNRGVVALLALTVLGVLLVGAWGARFLFSSPPPTDPTEAVQAYYRAVQRGDWRAVADMTAGSTLAYAGLTPRAYASQQENLAREMGWRTVDVRVLGVERRGEDLTLARVRVVDEMRGEAIGYTCEEPCTVLPEEGRVVFTTTVPLLLEGGRWRVGYMRLIRGWRCANGLAVEVYPEKVVVRVEGRAHRFAEVPSQVEGWRVCTGE